LSFKVLLHPKAAGFLERADPILKNRIRNSLKELEESPNKGEQLEGSKFWRVRIGDHRAIYEIDRKTRTIIVLFIGHRKDVYDDFPRLF